MSQELFYTSAPRGLQPGSRGFCTVAATTGMPAALMEKLESLSGYRPLFPPLDGKSGLNPVVYSHLRLALGAKTYSLLSRICSAGLDYTERTNKLAHHVVLESGELSPGGPAWLMRQPGFMEVAWDGQVGMLATGRVPPSGDSSPSVCKDWKDLTGDAGWAGVVAEAFTKNSGPPIYLIFEPGMEVLPLIDEVLSLLPAEQRWQISFSTYFTGLPQGVHCLWRGVPAGSAEAKNASRLPDALILNLCRPLGEATGGALVEQARTGISPQAFQSELPESGLTAESLPETRSGGKVRSREMGRPKRQAAGFGPRLPQQLPASAPGFPEPTPSGDVHVSGFDAPPLHLSERAKIESHTSKSGVWLVGIGLGAVLGILLTVTLITSIWFFSGYELVRPGDRAARQNANEFSNNPNSEHEEPNRQTENQQSIVASSKPKEKSEPKKEEKLANARPAEVPPVSKSQHSNSKKGSSKPEPPKNAGETRRGPAKISYVTLPLPPRVGGGGAENGEAKLELEKLSLRPNEAVDLILRGSKELSTGQEGKSLIVKYRTSEGGVGDPEPKDLAKFDLRDGDLFFKWLGHESAAPAKRSLLRQAILEINKSEKLYVALRRPVEHKGAIQSLPGQGPGIYRFPLNWKEVEIPDHIYLGSAEIAFNGDKHSWKLSQNPSPGKEFFQWEGDPEEFLPDGKVVTMRVEPSGKAIEVKLTAARPNKEQKQPRPQPLSTNHARQVEQLANAHNEQIAEAGLQLGDPAFSSVSNKPAPVQAKPQAGYVPERLTLTLESLVLCVKIDDVRVDVYRVGTN